MLPWMLFEIQLWPFAKETKKADKPFSVDEDIMFQTRLITLTLLYYNYLLICLRINLNNIWILVIFAL